MPDNVGKRKSTPSSQKERATGCLRDFGDKRARIPHGTEPRERAGPIRHESQDNDRRFRPTSATLRQKAGLERTYGDKEPAGKRPDSNKGLSVGGQPLVKTAKSGYQEFIAPFTSMT